MAKVGPFEKYSNNLEKSGFKDFKFRQTIFKDISGIREIEKAKKGFGLGSFIVINARKPGKIEDKN